MIIKLIKHFLQRSCPQTFTLSKIKKLNGIVLSFDDGPHPVHTPIILAELARRNIRAVFFVSGTELEKFPYLGKMILEYGHLLGNHTYDHLNVKDYPFNIYRKSIEKAERIIGSVQGENYQKLFRPPYSSFSISLIWYVIISNYLLVNWTVDSRDSFILDADELAKYICSLEIDNGDIILFHEDYPQTVAALPGILNHFQMQGIQITLPFLI